MNELLKKCIQEYKYKDITLDEMYKKLIFFSGSYIVFPQDIKDLISQVLLDYRWNNKPLNDTINEIETLLCKPNNTQTDYQGSYYRLKLLEDALKLLGNSKTP